VVIQWSVVLLADTNFLTSILILTSAFSFVTLIIRTLPIEKDKHHASRHAKLTNHKYAHLDTYIQLHTNNTHTLHPTMPRMLDNETSSKNEEEVLRKSLASLDVQRKSMEQEADAIYLELTTPPSEGVEPMGVDTPMIDQEGYPRGDIDVYRARSLRQRFRVLQTDHKALARNIEGMLLQLAAYKVSSVR
jgi:hypothetical protein